MLLLLLSSCAGKHSRVKVDVSPDALSEAIKNHTGFVSIKSLARVVVESQEGRMAFDQVTSAIRPDILEIAVFAPFGEMLALVSSDGDSVRMKTAGEELVFQNSEDFSFSFLYPGLPPRMGVRDIVNFLLAGAPFPLSRDAYTATGTVKDGVAVFQSGGTRPSRIEVDLDKNSITAIHWLFTEDKESTVRFSRHRKVAPNVYFPGKLVFETEGYSLSVTYDDDLKVNSDASSSRSLSVEAD